MAAPGRFYNRVGFYEKVQGVESAGDLITTIRRDIDGRYVEIWNKSEKGIELGIAENTRDPKLRKVFFLGPGKGINLIVNSAGAEAQFLMLREVAIVKTIPGKGGISKSGDWKTIGVLTLTANHYTVIEGIDGWWVMPFYSSSRLH